MGTGVTVDNSAALWSSFAPLQDRRHSMFGFLGRRKACRTYSKSVDDTLASLFSGFPLDILPSIRKAVDVDSMKRHYFKTGECPSGECAVLASCEIVGLAIAQMPEKHKAAAWASMISETPTHPLHFATGTMLEVAKQVARDEYCELLLCEIGGRLQNLSKQEITAKWTEAQVGKISDAIRRSG